MRKHIIDQQVISFTIPTPFLVGPVNTYLITGDLLTLVDSGPKTEEAWESFVSQLKSFGYVPEDIEQIVITHHHPDHVGMLERFENAKIVGHSRNAPWIQKDRTFLLNESQYFQDLYKRHGMESTLIDKVKDEHIAYLHFSSEVNLHQEIQENDPINGLPGWKVIETPGHAQSHINLFHSKRGILIAGDHLIADISSNAILEAPLSSELERPKTLIQYRDSLRKLLELNIQTVLPGHGRELGNPHKLIMERLLQQEARAKHIKNIIDNQRLTVFEICKKLFPKVYAKQPSLTFSETLGHLDLLEQFGEVHCVNEEHISFYLQN